MASLAVLTPDQGVRIRARALHARKDAGVRTPAPATSRGRFGAGNRGADALNLYGGGSLRPGRATPRPGGSRKERQP